MKKLVLMVCVLAAAACGGGKKTATKPTTPTVVAPEKGGGAGTGAKAEDGDDGSAKTPEDADGDERGGGGPKKQMSAADEKEALALLDQVTNDVCACKDMPCVQHVTEGMQEKFAKYDDTDPSPAGKQHAEDDSKKMAECLQKIAPAEAPEGGDKK